MKDGGKKCGLVKITCVIISAFILCILFWGTYRDHQYYYLKVKDYQIVVLGDSIMGECRDETAVPMLLEGLLGKNVYNGTLGGTYMSRLDQTRSLGFTKDSVSMVALSRSISIGDFAVQQDARIKENATDYFAQVINGLEAVDFDKAEVLIIGHGINDYHGEAVLYNEENAWDVYTFTGALRSSIELIRNTYPQLRIILVTPTYSWYRDEQLTCEEYRLGGNILEDYVNAELKLAKELDVEIIDVYHDYYPHEQWSDWELYTRDGLHPNEAGRVKLAQTIADYLLAG